MMLPKDIRYAGRLLARSPLFALTAVLSLAFGIGGAAAIFSLADALLLRPRPGITTASTLVDIGRATAGRGLDNFGYPLFEAMRDGTTLLDGMSAYRLAPDVMSLGDATSSDRVYASLVSGNYFTVVGTRPALGRFFVPEEDRTSDTHPVVVLSHAFWTRRFGQDPAIAGRTLRLNNRAYTVIGVAERGFTGTTLVGTDLWVPMAMDAHVRAADSSLRGNHDAVWMTAIGRLRPGVSVAQAQAELDGIMRSHMTARKDSRIERWSAAVVESRRVPAQIAGPVTGFVAMLFGLMLLVLIVACSNVAGMLVARGLDRGREFATRLAVGASRAALIRQLLIEGLVLALIAGALSIGVAAGLVGLLSAYQPSLPVPLAIELRVDRRVQAMAFGLAAIAAIAFSLLPALQTTRVDVMSVLRGAAASADRRRAWLRQVLVAGQVAVTLMLLVAAGLFLRSLQKAAAVDVGFNVQHVDTLQVDTRIGGYMTAAEGNRVVETLIERFRALPGVTSAAAARLVPLQGTRIGLGSVHLPGYVGPDGTDRVPADWDTVSADYFKTMELAIVDGRPFDARDRAGAPAAVIVNQTMAARLWPGARAVGRTLVHASDGEKRTLHVVGVARDSKMRMLSDEPANFIFVPLAQNFMSSVTFYVRRPAGLPRTADLRAAVAAFDPNLPVIHVETLEAATALALLPQKIAAWIAAAVASMGLLLVALGIYGMMASSVTQRRRELAIRIAVGAPAPAIVWLVVRQAAWLTIAGGTVGLLLGAGAATLMRGLLIDLPAIDPLAFSAAALVVAIVAAFAAWVPARRAAALDPVRALRAD